MLNLIFGTSGSGKSHTVRERIRRDLDAKKRVFLIVPEQQVYFFEQDFLPQLPVETERYFRIVGFDRLANWVFQQVGGRTKTDVSKGLRSLLMWQNLRKLSSDMEEYHCGGKPDPSLSELMLSVSDEMHICGISPEKLEQAAKHLDSGHPLRKKLRDIALVTATFDGLMEEQFGGNHADQYFRLAKILEQHCLFFDCHLYLDSFTDFTEGEFAVLRELFRQASEVTITLDCEGIRDQALSSLALTDTAKKLSKLGNTCGGGTVTEHLRGNYRCHSKELVLLNQELWNFSLTKEQRILPSISERGSIELWKPTNLYAEAEFVARRINKLHESGIPFGEIAIVVRNTDQYRGILDSTLEKQRIPCFFSDQTELSLAPAARYILTSLRCVSHGYQQEDVLNLLKTGLTPADDREIDLFESYVKTWDLNGKDFKEDVWNKNPDGYTTTRSPRADEILKAANTVKNLLISPLMKLEAGLRSAPKVSDKCPILYSYLLENQLPDHLLALAQEQLLLKQFREASDTLKVFETLTSALTDLAEVLSETEMNLEEFRTAVSLMLSNTSVGAIPTLSDCVMIGSADLLRVENIRVSFLLGLNEGVFPAALPENGLLKDSEKQILEELGLRLGKRADRMSANELYYVRRAISKPADRLILSSPSVSVSGKNLSPSFAYLRVKFLFPYLKETIYTLSPPDLPVDSRIPVQQERLTPESAASILGNSIHLTQSRLSSFVSCPYSYWCTYILKLRRQDRASVDYASAGTFIHYVLEQYMKQCVMQDGSFQIPQTKAESEVLANRVFSAYLQGVPFLSEGNENEGILHLFRRMRSTALVLIESVREELLHSHFVPTFFELKIDGGTDTPKPLKLSVTEGEHSGKSVLIGGIIDRVDLWQKDGKVYVKIIDYKTGEKEFSLSHIREGRDLQLLLYLFTLCQGEHQNWLPSVPPNTSLLPAGATYLYASHENQVTTPKRSGLFLSDKDLLLAMNDSLDSRFVTAFQETEDGVLQGKSLLSAEGFHELRQEICGTVLKTAQDIFSGIAKKTPSEEACGFCCIKNSCPLACRTKR